MTPTLDLLKLLLSAANDLFKAARCHSEEKPLEATAHKLTAREKLAKVLRALPTGGN